MSMQPYRGNQKLCVERRHPDGSLNLDGPPLPFRETTLDKLYGLYFNSPEGRDKESAGWEDLRGWLEKKDWSIRPKTW